VTPAAYPRVALCSSLRHHKGSALASANTTRRAGPALPSYLALHHAGFSMPPMLPPERWALTPPFHPYQTKHAMRRRLAGFPAQISPCCSAGGIFSVALSVGDSLDASQGLRFATAPLALPGALPLAGRTPSARDASFVTGSCEPTTTVSGLSSRLAILRRPDQRSPGSPATSIIQPP
jgi:hypothetical protein